MTQSAIKVFDKNSQLKIWCNDDNGKLIHIGSESKYKELTDEICSEINRLEETYGPLKNFGSNLLYSCDLKRIKPIEKQIDCIADIKSFEDKYGLYPMSKIDMKPFDKAMSKWIKDNVEFKTGHLEINVVLDEK